MIPSHTQVLIIEDDENDAFLIQRAFQKCGFSQVPHICRDGLDAIQYLEGKGEYADRARFPIPKVLVTDLKMPRLNGFGLLKWLREHPNMVVIPTIVMSASNDTSDVKYAYCLGANAYICKPSSPVDLEKSIAALLHFWERCEVPAPNAPSCEELTERRG
jgi:CheY-like chemotaxis protein